jgi:hypothetical protein
MILSFMVQICGFLLRLYCVVVMIQENAVMIFLRQKKEIKTVLTVKYMHLHVMSRSCSYSKLVPSGDKRTYLHTP